MLQIDLKGEKLALLPERAIWWERERTLLVADLHWGKSAHFRKHGIAIPLQAQTNDELRLAKLIREKKAERLVIAGDLFHSKANNQVDIFSHFRKSHSELQIDLVIGNHDILQKEKYASFSLTQHDECLDINPFCIAHDMIPGSKQFVIHGHVHPAVRIKSRGSNQPSIRLCCFAEYENSMVLPAFGEFTGSHTLEAGDCRHVYLIAGDKVMQWT